MTKAKVSLISKENICEGVIELKFERPDNFIFEPGQYINVYLSEDQTANAKSYTICSSPTARESLSISVRMRGEFSTSLHNLDAGDKVIIEGPNGHYLLDEYKDGLVYIAAGISVAPLISLLRYLEDKKDLSREINVLLSNKTNKSTPYFTYLSNNNFDNFSIKFINTREGGKRIDKKVISDIVKKHPQNTFSLCGSIDFVNSLWKMLVDLKVCDEKIITEAFY